MREEGVVTLHNWTFKTRSGLEPVPRSEPSTYQPISHCDMGAVCHICLVEEFDLNSPSQTLGRAYQLNCFV